MERGWRNIWVILVQPLIFLQPKMTLKRYRSIITFMFLCGVCIFYVCFVFKKKMVIIMSFHMCIHGKVQKNSREQNSCVNNLYHEVMFPQLVVFISVILNAFKKLNDQNSLQLNQNQNLWNQVMIVHLARKSQK